MNAESNMVFVVAEHVKELRFYKEHFGLDNFFNIFYIFYHLAHIPKDAENNVFSLYIDQSSIVRGFCHMFGVPIEEVALRFFNLLIEPEGKTKVYKIDVLRFY